MRRIGFLLLLILSSSSLLSQFYETGQTPFNLSWKEINTSHFKVVFPESIEKEANKFTKYLEASYPTVSKSLGHKPGKIPVLLNNQSVNSNGVVVWAPKRMELSTTPPQNTYSQPWLQQLALHELRHVVQVDKLNKGLIKALSFPFGQIISGGAAGFLPFWYLEGDAVVAETSLSRAGRGDQPEFKMGLRAITMEKQKRYPYRKAYFGSFKDYVPNYYELGYFMTSYARIEYNRMVWDTVLNYVPRMSYTLFPFYFGLKHYKTTKNKLYNDAFDYYKQRWQEYDTLISETRFIQISPDDKKNDFIEYRCVQVIDEKTYVALKTSLNEIPFIVLLTKQGKEKKLHAPGLIRDFSMSYANGYISWAEQIPDPLWSKKSYSEIKILNIANGKVRSVKEKTRYFSPDLSSGATKLIVSENTVGNENQLCIIDVESGNIIEKIPIPGNKSAQNPRWNKTDTKIVMTLLGTGGKSIAVYDVKLKNWKEILEPTFETISKPVFYKNDYILFNGSYGDIGNIFALEISSGKIFAVTRAQFGAYDSDVIANTNEIVYSNYTSQGFDLVIAPARFDDEISIPDVNLPNMPHDIIRSQENWNLNDITLPDKTYKSKKYNRFLNLFNFHSWLPFYVNLDELSVSDPAIYPGVQLFSQNLLNTAIASAGYSYQNKNHFFNTTFTFKGMRPIFEFSLDYGGDIVPFSPQNVDEPNVTQKYMSQNYRLYLPVNLTRNGYFTNVIPSIELEHGRDVYFDFPTGNFRKGLTFFKTNILFYRLRKTAHRDIHPKFGQVLQAQFLTSPVDRQNFGSMVRLFGTLYFPGIFQNHSFILKGNYQNQEIKNYFLPFSFSFPRGFETIRTTTMATLSADYALPIIYPDLDLLQFLYFKRIKGKAFYDLLHINPLIRVNNRLTESGNRYYHSYGMEITTDFHIANILFPLNMGYRFGYQPELGRTFGEFVFNLDIARF